MTYIISLAFIVVASIVTLAIGGGHVSWTVDVPSFLVMSITVFTVLVASGSVKDFFGGLKMAASKEEQPPLRLARSVSALSVVIQSVACACALMLFLCMAMALFLRDDKLRRGPVMALGLVSLFYAGNLLLILLPARSVLRRKLASSGLAPSAGSVRLSWLPGKPYICFAVGISLLFLSLTLGHTFVLSDFPAELVRLVPAMLLFLYGGSYILLLAGKMLLPYLQSIGMGFRLSCPADIGRLEECVRAVDFVIAIRLALAFCGAALLSLITLGSLESANEMAFRFSLPLVLLGLSFLSVLLLLPVRTRICMVIDCRNYGGGLHGES